MVWFILILNLFNISTKDACVGLDYSWSISGQYNYFGGYRWNNGYARTFPDLAYDIDKYLNSYIITGYTSRPRPISPAFPRNGLYLIVNARPGLQMNPPTIYPYIGFDHEKYYSSVVLESGHFLSAGIYDFGDGQGRICEVNENNEPTSFNKYLIDEINEISKIEFGHDDYYVIVGKNYYNGQICLLKDDFQVKYEQDLAYSTNYCTYAYDIAVLNDSGYIVVGSGSRAIIKLNSVLDTIWTISGGGNAICLTNDGGFAVTSNSSPQPIGYISRYDSLGQIIWSKTDTGKYYFDLAYDSIMAKFVAVGNVGFDRDSVYIVSLDSTGQEIASYTFTGTSNSGEEVRATSVLNNSGSFIIVGFLYQISPIKPYYQNDSMSNDVFILSWNSNEDIVPLNHFIDQNKLNDIKSDSTFTFNVSILHEKEILISFSLENSANVNIDIYNVVGQKIGNIFSGNIIAGQHNFRYYQNANDLNLSKGVYFVRIKLNGLPYTRSFTLFH
ncbi:T9SS type A sorting domain-containing protein [candidate division WOR-3 bacterium]|nr:T9SS type A sorting domain-containing protein [candidate division WOR-3 bacterium]